MIWIGYKESGERESQYCELPTDGSNRVFFLCLKSFPLPGLPGRRANVLSVLVANTWRPEDGDEGKQDRSQTRERWRDRNTRGIERRMQLTWATRTGGWTYEPPALAVCPNAGERC